jgi:hypothetical protein
MASDTSWFRDFLTYSQHARVIIVDAETLSPGIAHEIESIVERDLGSRIMLVATGQELKVLSRNHPAFVERVRWKVLLRTRNWFDDGSLAVPENFRQQVRQLLVVTGS